MGDLADLQRSLRETVPSRWPWVLHKVEAPERVRCEPCYLIVGGQLARYVEAGQPLAVVFTYQPHWDLHSVTTGHRSCLRARRLMWGRGHPHQEVLPDDFIEWFRQSQRDLFERRTDRDQWRLVESEGTGMYRMERVHG